MKIIIISLTSLVLLFASARIGSTAEFAATVQERQEVVAVVNGEEIFLSELYSAVAEHHRDIKDETTRAQMDLAGVLERLINAKLILQEATDVGLEKRPEIKEKIKRFEDQLMVKLIKNKQFSGLEPDPSDIDSFYQDEIRHWTFKAISFKDFTQAKAFHEELDGEGDFEAVGEKYVNEGLANWEGEEQEVKEAEIVSELSAGFIGKEVGSVTPIFQAFERFFVFKLTDRDYKENSAALVRATRKALNLKKEEILNEFTDRLIEKYVSVDQKVLATVGKGEFIDAAKDSRVLAEIIDDDPILAADLFLYLQGKSYHGGKPSDHIETLKSDPESVLNDALEKRLLLKEARETGFDRTERYKARVSDFEDSLIFGMYMEEFLVPLAQISPEEIKAAYEKRADEFMMSQVVKVDTLTFADGDNARKALDSLKRGADIHWLEANAQGLKGEGGSHDDLILDTLPEEVNSLISGLKEGDAGLYKADQETYKVFVVREFPPREREPFDKVRSKIGTEMFNKRLKQVIEDLADELREISEITIYEDKLYQGPFQQGRD